MKSVSYLMNLLVLTHVPSRVTSVLNSQLANHINKDTIVLRHNLKETGTFHLRKASSPCHGRINAGKIGQQLIDGIGIGIQGYRLRHDARNDGCGIHIQGLHHTKVATGHMRDILKRGLHQNFIMFFAFETRRDCSSSKK